MSRIKQPISTQMHIFLGILGIFALIVVYGFLSQRQYAINPQNTTIPSFAKIGEGFVQIVTPRPNPLRDDEDFNWWSQVKSTWLFQDATATFSRLFIGLFCGCLMSVVLGVAMGCYDSFGAFLFPLISFLSKVPGTAMLAVFFVVVGTGEIMFTTMIAFGTLPTLTQAIYISAKNDLHDEEINKAYTLGASNFEVIWNVVFQQILPKILENIRLQIGPAMVYLIAAEMLVGEVGMGFQARMQGRMLNMAVVYDYIIILGVSGLLMDRGMLALRRWLCPWYSRWR